MGIKSWKLILLYFIWFVVSTVIFFQNVVRLEPNRQYTFIEVLPYILNLEVLFGFAAQLSFLSRCCTSEDTEDEGLFIRENDDDN